MTGKYVLKISDKYVSYELELSRQVTILKGNSGTGKSTFVQLCYLAMCDNRGGVECNLSKKLVVPDGTPVGVNFTDMYGGLTDKIFIFDEHRTKFFRTDEFAQFVKDSGNYFVIVSRTSCVTKLDDVNVVVWR